MLNYVSLVGRIAGIKEQRNEEKEKTIIKIAVGRDFKNEDGIYETDVFNTILTNGIAIKVKEYLQEGDMVGLKGRLQTNNNEVEIIVEKVSFLSSKAYKEESI